MEWKWNEPSDEYDDDNIIEILGWQLSHKKRQHNMLLIKSVHRIHSII